MSLRKRNKYAKELREDLYRQRVVPLKQRQQLEDIRVEEQLELFYDDNSSDEEDQNDLLRSTVECRFEEDDDSGQDLSDKTS